MATGGDCFDAAVKFVMDKPKEEQDSYQIVHGYPTGQGDIEGMRFIHAWVETAEEIDGFSIPVVIDPSNGREVTMPKVMYYKLGKIDPDEVVIYEPQEAFLNCVTYGHWGPWDLEHTQEEVEYADREGL